MQAAQQDQPDPLGVVFDSSLDGIDHVLALAMLFHLQATRLIRVASLSTGGFNLKNAAFLDAVARFYSSGSRDSDYRPRSVMLPIGIATVGPQSDTAPPMISAVLSKVGDDGSAAYPHGVNRLTDTAEPAHVIRNALTAYEDGNAAVVVAGSPVVNPLSLLDLPDGEVWAASKARVLSVAGGRFDGGAVDPALAADVVGFRRLLAEWPTPVVMAGTELNDALPFPGSSVEALANWAPDHPVVDAYHAYGSMPYDAPTQALAAVLYAVSPEEDYFGLSEPGTITILEDGRTQFTPSPSGRHHHLIVTPDRTERILDTYVTLVTEEPPNPRESRD